LIQSAVRSAGSVFNLRQLRENQPYRLVRTLDGLLEEFEYQIDADRFLRIVAPDRTRPDVLDAQVLPYEKETAVATIRGVIDAGHPSLIAAMEASGRDLHPARDGGGRHLGSDRLRERSAARRHVRRCCPRSRRATGSSPAGSDPGARFS
jgi:hypothetical protein